MRILKSLATKTLSRGVLTLASKRYIFVFHDVSDPDSQQFSESYSTPVEVFRNQIEFLSQRFEFVPLNSVLEPRAILRKRRIASLTFDDGFLSVRDDAFPFLSSKGIPFALFVNGTAVKHNRLSNCAIPTEPSREFSSKVFLDEDDVRYLSGRGVLIGSHSYNHKVLSACSDEELDEEILQNKFYLESLTKQKVDHFALPFGKREHYSSRVLEFCAAAGHDFVYTSNPTYFDPGRLGGKPRLIPRIGLTNQSAEELLFLINRPLIRLIDI